MKFTRIPTVVAGLGCRYPQCPDADTLAGRLRRGRQAAGALPRPPGATPALVLRDALIGVAREALDSAMGAPRSGVRYGIIYVPENGEGVAAPPSVDDVRTVAASAGIDPNAIGSVNTQASLVVALDQARVMLNRENIGAVLLLTGTVRMTAPDGPGAASPSFSIAAEKSAPTLPLAEGAAAVVLVREGALRPNGTPWPVRARILAVARATEAGARGVEGAFVRLLRSADWRQDSVGLIGTVGRRETTIAEITAIARLYKEGPRETALTGVRATISDAGAAANLGALLAAVLCLDRAMVPVLPGWREPGPALLRQAEGLYVATNSEVWCTRPDATMRRAAILLEDVATNGSAGTAVIGLDSGPDMEPVAVTAATIEAPLLFPIAAADRAGLEAGLKALSAGLEAGTALRALSREAMRSAMAAAGAPRGLALVAASPAELTREIAFMHRALDKGEASGKPVRTPNGSVYTAVPLGLAPAKVAFVYPGVGAGYPGLGRDVLLSFARHLAIVEPLLGRRIPTLMRTDLTSPRKLERATEQELANASATLNADVSAMLLVSIAYGVAYTHILRASLGVQPHAAFGYSIGELSMRIALGQLQDWADLETKLHAPCLVTGLTGPMTTVREFWKRRGGAMAQAASRQSDPLWASHIVKAPVEDVLAAANEIGDVFITAINTPEEIAIAGAPDACAALLRRLGALSMQLEVSFAIHAPPAELERETLYGLCNNPLAPVAGVDFYTALTGEPVPQTREETAATVSRMMYSKLDFRGLIDAAYRDGVRVFIETGVRNNCTNWINATLGDRPHVAVPMDIKGLPSDVAWMRAVAILFANRLPLDLTELADPEFRPQTNQLSDILSQGLA